MDKLKIMGVKNPISTQKKEYIQLVALKDISNLGEYAIFDETFRNNSISGIHKHFYIFPSKPVKQGDVIYLSMGAVADTATNPDVNGNRTHYLYTGADVNWINNTGDRVRLIKFGYVQNISLEPVS